MTGHVILHLIHVTVTCQDFDWSVMLSQYDGLEDVMVSKDQCLQTVATRRVFHRPTHLIVSYHSRDRFLESCWSGSVLRVL